MFLLSCVLNLFGHLEKVAMCKQFWTPNEVLEIWMCRFGGVSSSLSDAEGEESDGVELEKSNVLLMGPTGSGLIKTSFLCILAE